MKKYLALLIVGVVLIVSGIAYLRVNQTTFSDLRFTPTPAPSSLSKPTVVLTDSYKGTIISFNNSLVAVNVGQVKSFNITETTDFQGVTYGSLEQGNAVTVPSSRVDLTAGKQVFIVTLKGTNIVKSIYIFR